MSLSDGLGLDTVNMDPVSNRHANRGRMTVNIDDISTSGARKRRTCLAKPGDAGRYGAISQPPDLRTRLDAQESTRIGTVKAAGRGTRRLPDGIAANIRIAGRRRLGRAGVAGDQRRGGGSRTRREPGGEEGRPDDPRRQPAIAYLLAARLERGWRRAGRARAVARHLLVQKRSEVKLADGNWRGGLPYLNIILDHCEPTQTVPAAI